MNSWQWKMKMAHFIQQHKYNLSCLTEAVIDALALEIQ
jgi:hypothetical protein